MALGANDGQLVQVLGDLADVALPIRRTHEGYSLCSYLLEYYANNRIAACETVTQSNYEYGIVVVRYYTGSPSSATRGSQSLGIYKICCLVLIKSVLLSSTNNYRLEWFGGSNILQTVTSTTTTAGNGHSYCRHVVI